MVSELDAQIIVVGAGMSGIAAARMLTQAGKSVLALEARERIGGRIDTQAPFGYPLDYGASWIQGWTDNPLLPFVRDGQYRLEPSNYASTTAFDSYGQLVPTRYFRKLSEACWSLFSQINRTAKKRAADESLQSAFDRALEQSDLDAKDQAFVRWLARAAIEGDYAAELSVLSSKHYQDALVDDQNGFLADGYGEVVTDLARGLDIRLGEVVQQIDIGDTVEIKTAAARFCAEQVLVSLPLGVLKSESVCFRPALPPDKVGAFERLHVGLLDKIFMAFPECFWPEDSEFFGQIGAELIESVLNLKKFNGKNCLAVFISGGKAEQLETEDLTLIAQRIMVELRGLFGPSIPDPDQVVMTRWRQDPFALGSYSSVPVGSSRADRTTLGRPIGSRLFFAGEATEPGFPGTVHGAFMSGERAAQEMLAFDA